MAQLVSEYGTPINAAATVSGATSAATRTITCPPLGKIRLRTIAIYTSAGQTCTMTVTIGGVVVMDFGTLSTGVSATILSPNLVGSGGQNVLINIGATGAGTTTTTHSAEVL